VGSGDGCDGRSHGCGHEKVSGCGRGARRGDEEESVSDEAE
jgi:hypothetical protein